MNLCKYIVPISCLVLLLGSGQAFSESKESAIPKKLKSISIETGRSHDNNFVLAGRDSAQQLVVTAKDTTGKVHDVTRTVQYQVSPQEIVNVSETGQVTGLKEGQATIVAKGPNDLVAKTTVKVTNIVEDLPINFANEVVPIFTRYGCNSGGCHGKSGGQNGFSLSLLGFEPQEDFDFLVKEGRGRRILPSIPTYSLLLRKASGQMAHGGGGRIKVDSAAYRVLRRWIEQGTPYGDKDDPVVSRIEVTPASRVLAPNSSQQLVVVAHYSDGSTKDVTSLAQFESNATDLAHVSESGVVTTSELPGVVAVMARFQIHVGVFRATIPLDAPMESMPVENNFIDRLVFKQLKSLGLPPSEGCKDSTFLRRVTIDIAGRLPTFEETKKFLADESKDKRAKLVDRLLATEDYADYFANKWSAVLRNKRENSKEDTKPTFAFHRWIRESLAKNKPYDHFVREILTATGKEVQTPPVTWYREVRGPSAQLEDVSQLFMGQRIGCAKCHHHPLEKWSQDDYYGFAAFFSQVKYKDPPRPKRTKKNRKKKGKVAKPLLEILHQPGIAKAKNPRSGDFVYPTGLGGKTMKLPANVDPRTKLADWLTSPKNPYFARVLVNRYWKHFMGRGLVEPEDDMRVTNPPTNPELLDALEQHFIASKYDLKNLIKTICNSRVYQLSGISNKFNKTDHQNFSRFYARRLHAEVLLDAIDQVTDTRTRFTGTPQGTRAVQLPDNAFDSYFLSVFGRPSASSACECERTSSLNLAQLLHLLNSSDILKKVAGTRAQKISRDRRSHEEKLRELYLVALSRKPSQAELGVLTSYIEQRQRNTKAAYEDVIWSLINSPEFLFNH
ncbi:MAG: DUF1549 domain-containing protein [Gemmataceae bacterium]